MSQKTSIVNCRTTDYDVFIGRPSIWGNPFKIGMHGSREEVIELYRQYLIEHPHLIELAREQLKGMVLGCYCDYPKQDCHGRILIEMMNDDEE
jgi:hypothetical protein